MKLAGKVFEEICIYLLLDLMYNCIMGNSSKNDDTELCDKLDNLINIRDVKIKLQ